MDVNSRPPAAMRLVQVSVVDIPARVLCAMIPPSPVSISPGTCALMKLMSAVRAGSLRDWKKPRALNPTHIPAKTENKEL